MNRLKRLARDNKRTADLLADEVLGKPIPRVRGGKPETSRVGCVRVLEGAPGVDLTPVDVAAWLPTVPPDATLSAIESYAPGEYMGHYSRPTHLSGLRANWKEDKS